MARLLEQLVAHAALIRRIIVLILAGLIVADLLMPSAYNRFPWESIGGFGAFYGLLSGALIIIVSRALGHALLYRPEDYYDE